MQKHITVLLAHVKQLIIMQCVLFQESEKSCYARVVVSLWKVDEDAINKYCKTEKFDQCPRYKAFIEYQQSST